MIKKKTKYGIYWIPDNTKKDYSESEAIRVGGRLVLEFKESLKETAHYHKDQLNEQTAGSTGTYIVIKGQCDD